MIMNRVQNVCNKLINCFKVEYDLFIALFGTPFVMYIKARCKRTTFSFIASITYKHISHINIDLYDMIAICISLHSMQK